MGSPEQQPPLYPVFSHAPAEGPSAGGSPPSDDIGGAAKDLPPGALPETPDNRPVIRPSQLDKLDGFGQGDPYDWP